MANRLNRLTGSDHPNWKGDSVLYHGLHRWVEGQRGKPSLCEDCGTIKASKYHWANISGQYKRDAFDFKRLCQKCHRKFDKQYGEGNGNSKLVESQVIRIRELYARGDWTHKQLGSFFNVSTSMIGHIVNNDFWRHINKDRLKLSV